MTASEFKPFCVLLVVASLPSQFFPAALVHHHTVVFLSLLGFWQKEIGDCEGRVSALSQSWDHFGETPDSIHVCVLENQARRSCDGEPSFSCQCPSTTVKCGGF